MTPSYVRERIIERALDAQRLGRIELAEGFATAAASALAWRDVDGVRAFLPPTRAEVDRLASWRGPRGMFSAEDRAEWLDVIRLLRSIELGPDADVARQARRAKVYMHVHGDPRAPRCLP